MNILFKKLNPNAIIPTYAYSGDAGLDLIATSISINFLNSSFLQVEYGTGLAIEIPSGYVGFLIPRSSSKNNNLRLSNTIGVIDSGYRGEIKAIFTVPDEESIIYDVGDRIVQLVIVPCPEINPVETNELSTTERGGNNFGSSGR